MLILGTFINDIINRLIRNLDWPVRVTISCVLITVAVLSFYYSIKNQPKDKPGFKIGWFLLFIISTLASVLYITL